MAYQLTCPCGEDIIARDEEFINVVNAHLEAQHEGRTYPGDMIMMMAVPVPDPA